MGAAVLIRALEPTAGIEEMMLRRGGAELCNGPGKLTQALGIGLGENGTSLVSGPVRVLARLAAAVRDRAADRDHEGRGPAVALLRAGLAGRLAAVASGPARESGRLNCSIKGVGVRSVRTLGGGVSGNSR